MASTTAMVSVATAAVEMQVELVARAPVVVSMEAPGLEVREDQELQTAQGMAAAAVTAAWVSGVVRWLWTWTPSWGWGAVEATTRRSM